MNNRCFVSVAVLAAILAATLAARATSLVSFVAAAAYAQGFGPPPFARSNELRRGLAEALAQAGEPRRSSIERSRVEASGGRLRSRSFTSRTSASHAVASAEAGGGQDEAKPTTVGGCPAEPLAFHKCALEKAKTFNPRRTADGKPDMQGYWLSRLTAAFSVEEVSETEPLTNDPIMPWTIGPGMIVDPPDRKIPYQPWAAEIGRKGQNFRKYIDPRSACGSGGVPRLPLQSVSQLLQPLGGDHVVWLFEDHHVYRVITTDGRPHVGENIKLWNGDSLGRWERNTLVVDVTNVNGYTWFDDAGNFYTDAAHLVERLTMIDPDTIHYEVTIEDPKAYTRPWKMVWAFVREKEPGFELLEEACLEGERDLPHFLQLGSRYYFGESWRRR